MPRELPRTRVRELSEAKNRPRAYRAFLAEDYDGIGQYTKISLSRNAVTAGLRARISAGDFGTGQMIPVGTPVTVFVYHGQIEILSLGAK